MPSAFEVPLSFAEPGRHVHQPPCGSWGCDLEWKAGLLSSARRCLFSIYSVPGMKLSSRIRSEQNEVSIQLCPHQEDR